MSFAAVQKHVAVLFQVITYPGVENRDMILEAGMAEGMEISYARMESELMAMA